MDRRCVTPEKQIVRQDEKQCPGAPQREKKTTSRTAGLTIEIPKFDGNFTDPKDEIPEGAAVKKARKG
jgi:hypothetical protein